LTNQVYDFVYPFNGLLENCEMLKNSHQAALLSRGVITKNDQQVISWQEYSTDTKKFVYCYKEHRHQILKAETQQAAFDEINVILNDTQNLDVQNVDLNIEQYFIN
jgi:hypothetical protein